MTYRLRVSIIVPTYNRSALVCDAIDSLLQQTHIPDEIIVVDDGSTDDTQTVLSKYQTPVIVLYKPNGGLAAARNTGLAQSTGDLIGFLDDDDTLTPNSIEVRANFLEQNSSYEIVYGDIMISIGNKRMRHSENPGATANSGDIFADFAEHNRRPIHAFMMRRICYERVGGFEPTFPGLEDYQYWMRLAMHFRFYYLDEIMGVYRFHGDQMSSKQRFMQETEIKAREDVFQTATFVALAPARRARIYCIHATEYFQLDNLAEARKWYLHAIRTAPTYVRSYLLLGLTALGHGVFNLVSRLYNRARTLAVVP